MSTYDDSSLFLYPSGYKASVLFAQKPMDANGQLAFTRSNDTATRVASNGLIEKVRTNLFLQSNGFDTASWSKSAATTVTANQPDPFGGNNAFLVQFGGATTESIGQLVSMVSGTPYNLSVWIKGVNLTDLRVAIGANLVIVTSQVINGTWVRVSATQTVGSTGSLSNQIRAGNSSGQSFYIYGAQLETSDFGPTPYIPTTASAVSVGPVANIPRIDYLGGGCGKLLLEPQRTNYQLYSENSAQWSTPADGLTVVYNTSETIDPSGYYGAEKVTSVSGNKRMFNGLTNPSGVLTMSAFVKKGTGDDFLLRTTSGSVNIQYNLTTLTITATAGTGTITNYGNGWYRVTASTTSAIANEVARYQFPNADGEYMYFWGAMVENGAYATSYINTLNSAVTRGADACSKTGISSLIGQTEGTIFLQFDNRLLTSYPNEYPLQIVGSGGHQLWLRKESGSNTFTARLIVSSSTIWTFSNIPVPNGNTKIAISYKTGDSAIYLNGTQFGSTSTAAFSGNAFADLYFNLSGAANPELILNQALLFKTRLPNSELASMTTL